MNYIVALILSIGIFWGGYFFFYKPDPIIESYAFPVENCFTTDDNFLICKLKEN